MVEKESIDRVLVKIGEQFEGKHKIGREIVIGSLVDGIYTKYEEEAGTELGVNREKVRMNLETQFNTYFRGRRDVACEEVPAFTRDLIIKGSLDWLT